MNTQTKLSEHDATKLENLQLRRQLLANEWQKFSVAVFASYGNPGEGLNVNEDGTLTRTPETKPPQTPARGRKAR